MKKKKMFDVSLNNLTAKPSDFLPGRYEQLTIDDELRKVETKYRESLVIKCDSYMPQHDLQRRYEEFVKQREKGIVLLPKGFDLICVLPPDIELLLQNDAEKFIDDFLEGKYD